MFLNLIMSLKLVEKENEVKLGKGIWCWSVIGVENRSDTIDLTYNDTFTLNAP